MSTQQHPDPDVYTFMEGAAKLRVSRWTLAKRLQGDDIVFPDGRRIKTFTFGGRRRFIPRAALERFLEQPAA